MFPCGAHQRCHPQSIPGWKTPAPSSTKPGCCSHCRTNAFYRLDKEEGNHPPEPFGRKITQWDENQSIDGIGEEDIAIKKGGVHDTEHCQEEHSPGESSRKTISPLLLVIIHNKEAQSEEKGKDAIHLSRQQQCQHICHPIITPQRISMLYASIVHIEMLHGMIENNTCYGLSSQGISHVNTTVFQS